MNNAFSGSSDDRTHESVSIAVIDAIATYRDSDPIELPPLYEWIDPDALDTLFAPTERGGPRGGRVEFRYDGHAVVVDCADEVSITVDGSPVAESIAVECESPTPTGV